MLRFETIGYTIGILLLIIGVAEIIPALIDFKYHYANAFDFLRCSVISIFFGGILVIANMGHSKTLNVRWVFLLTTLSWISMSLFAALPLYFSDLDISFTDAFFESISGVTTTGSTILSNLDTMSPGILFWRSLMQWIGGIGIVAFAIILLPFLRIGGMQLFQAESSDRSEKVMSRSNALVFALLIVYIMLTILCALSFKILGMSWFDAINHAMTTISTGGYSTHDASFGHFENPALQYTGAFFMLLGGLPFVLYIKLIFKNKFRFFQDDQVKTLLIMLSVFSLIMGFWLWKNSDYGLEESIRQALFNIVSIITTTGFATDDYNLWGPFAVIFFFFITYLGACAGSTTGGLKVMRLVVVSKTLARQIKSLLYPHGTFTIRYQGKPIDYSVCATVMGFLSLYVSANVLLTILLSWSGLDILTAISGAATAIANVGPGLGDTIGPAGNFSSLPETSKWLLSFGMLLGRLEILTLIILFRPEYWRS